MTFVKTRPVLTVLLGVSAPLLIAQSVSREPQGFARKHLQFSQDQISEMERGAAVAKILNSTHGAELAPFGVIRIRVSMDYFLERYRDIATFKKSSEVLQIGKFRMPPRPEDLSGLTLDPEELESLRSCRIGDCSMKMPVSMIERLRKETDWSAADSKNQVEELYRRMLFEYVKTYLTAGNAVLPEYQDKKEPVRLREELHSLLEASPYIAEYVRELQDYLAQYPRASLQDSEDFVYWSKEKFGFKPVLSITHVTIYRPKQPDAVLIASKQIYANHYFIGSLGLSAFVAAPKENAEPGAYLMYLNRSRVDLLKGFFGGIKRFFAKRRVLDGMEKHLRSIKERLETGYRARSAERNQRLGFGDCGPHSMLRYWHINPPLSLGDQRSMNLPLRFFTSW